MMENECIEGCAWDRYFKEKPYPSRCPSLVYNKNNTCPCEQCIIKVMCNEECFRWKGWMSNALCSYYKHYGENHETS